MSVAAAAVLRGGCVALVCHSQLTGVNDVYSVLRGCAGAVLCADSASDSASVSVTTPSHHSVSGVQQDHRHRRGIGGFLSPVNDDRTSNVPFLALLRGRQTWAALENEVRRRRHTVGSLGRWSLFLLAASQALRLPDWQPCTYVRKCLTHFHITPHTTYSGGHLLLAERQQCCRCGGSCPGTARKCCTSLARDVAPTPCGTDYGACGPPFMVLE